MDIVDSILAMEKRSFVTPKAKVPGAIVTCRHFTHILRYYTIMQNVLPSAN